MNCVSLLRIYMHIHLQECPMHIHLSRIYTCKSALTQCIYTSCIYTCKSALAYMHIHTHTYTCIYTCKSALEVGRLVDQLLDAPAHLSGSRSWSVYTPPYMHVCTSIVLSMPPPSPSMATLALTQTLPQPQP